MAVCSRTVTYQLLLWKNRVTKLLVSREKLTHLSQDDTALFYRPHFDNDIHSHMSLGVGLRGGAFITFEPKFDMSLSEELGRLPTIDEVLDELKSNGTFDQFRKSCLASVQAEVYDVK